MAKADLGLDKVKREDRMLPKDGLISLRTEGGEADKKIDKDIASRGETRGCTT